MMEPDIRAPGRPKVAEKRDAILNAARELLLESGYAETSIDRVAQHAGVGKPTVYSHFGSKKELFDAVIGSRISEVLDKLGSLREPTDNPRADLETFAMSFGKMILSADGCQWDRLIVGESARHPELARTMFETGPRNLLRILAEYLQSQHDARRLTLPSAELAAEQLMGLLFGVDHIRSRLMSLPQRTDSERNKRIRAAIDVFMAAYQNKEKR